MQYQRWKLFILLGATLAAPLGCGGGGGAVNATPNALSAVSSSTPTSVGTPSPFPSIHASSIASPAMIPSPVATNTPVIGVPLASPSAVVQSTTSVVPGSLSSTMPIRSALPLEVAQQADLFVDSIGMNIHLLYPDTAYVNQYQAFRQYLINSGVRHIRDGMVDTTWQPYYDHLVDLASVGIHATLAVYMGEAPLTVQQFPTRIPGVIEAIEAPNEADLSGNPNWVQALRTYVPQFYTAVKTGALTSQFPVYGPSLTTTQAYNALGNLSQYLDYSNMHNYFGNHNPGAPASGIPGNSSSTTDVLDHIQAAKAVSGNKPVVTTENGYCNAPNTLNSVPISVQTKYIPRMFLVQWMSGVQRTFEYEFIDNGSGCDGSYGLIASANGQLTPKPAYYAVSGMIAALQDPGGSFTAGSLGYQIVSSGTNVLHKLFEKRDGTLELVIWQEVPSVDASGSIPLLITPLSTTINLAANPKVSTITTFGDSGQPTVQPLTWTNGQAQVMVSDSISIISLKP